MPTVRDIIARKPHVHHVAPASTVFDALRLMADHDIGALIVIDGDRIAGLFSERDYARKVILAGKSSRDLRVLDIMTTPVVCANPEWSVYDCMAVMTDEHVRHLPVVDGDRLVGVVSIGDVVSAVVAEQASTIGHLERYIAAGA